MKITQEQQAAVESKADKIKIRAFAGAGKTSTLVNFALTNNSKRILYLAFNKSVQTEAEQKFPKNVIARTAHSIAYSTFGKMYTHKLSGNIRPHMLLQLPEMKRVMRENIPDSMRSLFCLRIIEAINKFTSSTDPYITQDHFNLSEKEQKDFPMRDSVNIANHYWTMMCDVKNTDAPMTHDGYLKLHLDGGRGFGKFDIIMLDEGQDSNPVTMQMFNDVDARKIMVGDSHQSIYQFRGAVNAMEEFDADEELFLTQSFRFGPRIAEAANMILHLKGEKNYLFGTDSIKDNIVSKDDIYESNYAYISKSNIGLFIKAAESLKQNKSIHFLGGIQGYSFTEIEDAYHLSLRRPHLVKDPFLKTFKSFDELGDYAKNSSDPEVSKLISCIAVMKGDVPYLLQKLKNQDIQAPMNKANVILSTIHKSKGLEFDNVQMDNVFSNDENGGDASPAASMLFKNSIDILSRGEKLTIDERIINAGYVAATRAKKTLCAGFIDGMGIRYRQEVRLKYVNSAARLNFDIIEKENKELKPEIIHNDQEKEPSSIPIFSINTEKSVSNQEEVSSSQLRRARRRTF